jgi:nucleoside-diphosphate-sugar epimerase
MATTGLTVAVTGPTGDLGLGIVDALERSRAVKRIVGMARRPFEPGERGWRKTEYRQGDVTDAASVRELVDGADVVVHLAFAILSASDATRELNVAGSRRVFEAAAAAGVERICYASSVAAYGFHDDTESLYGHTIAQATGPVGDMNALIRFGASIDNATAAGLYITTLSLIATSAY